jgi:hypothetical protein
LDVSVPAIPKVIGYLPYPRGPSYSSGSCSIEGSTRTLGTSTVIAGSHAYIGSFERFDIIDLE